jgi:hypothetical protein
VGFETELGGDGLGYVVAITLMLDELSALI